MQKIHNKEQALGGFLECLLFLSAKSQYYHIHGENNPYVRLLQFIVSLPIIIIS